MFTPEEKFNILSRITLGNKKEEGDATDIRIGGFGAYDNRVAEFVVGILKNVGVTRRVIVPKELPEYSVGTVVVCLSNPNSHNYQCNQPLMVVSSSQAMGTDGKIGNSLPVGIGSAMRLATEYEIREFCDNYRGKPFFMFM
jgi:hypothetical protein